MGAYQGRALEPARRRRPPRSLPSRVLRVIAVLAVAAVLVQIPWRGLRARIARVHDVRVAGAHYLDPARVAEETGIAIGQDLFALDLDRARQRLLLDPRIAQATVGRRLPFGVGVTIVEREPVLLVSHGVPWEIDSTGVLLEPLGRGVVADVPLLVGPRFERLAAGAEVRTDEVRRGLAWIAALAAREIQIAGQVSEIDVSDPAATGLTLMDGVRVLAPGWPPSLSRLSALRLVLADLKLRGTEANEVDLRFEDQVIVRPAAPAGATHGVAEARSG
ncbi:MAG: FtsQ-type POTRA domain-containing protein [Candidatus Eisenbacteria bacterium]|uniref:FtsQ-type POTRA domain-containing protein n=1 Tax=Eiseniibacteriota bacterium TaxID=2212470 RepID=A0A9D6L7E7_UNCEI|nr:FtsQ-type POTRA domain-containing protein [Candidatus Eisenbacteria bacterium]MBI3540298.1 FtsQ-type POTRA domain-containing protein [Candidatus Eisenbacteria bacterium]